MIVAEVCETYVLVQDLNVLRFLGVVADKFRVFRWNKFIVAFVDVVLILNSIYNKFLWEIALESQLTISKGAKLIFSTRFCRRGLE